MKTEKGGCCWALAAVLLWSDHVGSKETGPRRLHTLLGKRWSQCSMFFFHAVFCCCYSRIRSDRRNGPKYRGQQQVCHFSRSLGVWEEAGSFSTPVRSTGEPSGEGFIWCKLGMFPTRSPLLSCRGGGSRTWEQGQPPLHMTKHAWDSIDTRCSYLNNSLPLWLSHQGLVLVNYILKSQPFPKSTLTCCTSMQASFLTTQSCSALQLWPGTLSARFPCHI